LEPGCLGQTRSGEQPDSSTDGSAGQSGSGATVADAWLKLEGYQNHKNAINDGYQNTGTCIEGLGTPFVRNHISQVSYDTPNAFLYERIDTDKYELLGAEWFVPASDYEDPLALFTGGDRQTFRGPMEGHYSDQPTHYNPNLTCSD
jgi:hypothetical protein